MSSWVSTRRAGCVVLRCGDYRGRRRGSKPAYPRPSLVFSGRPRASPAISRFLPQLPSPRGRRCAVGSDLPAQRTPTMLIHATEPLFAWGQLEDCPTLTTIRDCLEAVPDQELLAGLVAARGHGRDDYPVERLWHVVLLTILLRHTSFNACLDELHRNPALCRLIAITAEDQSPNGWNLSRFLDTLGQEPHLAAPPQVFDT